MMTHLSDPTMPHRQRFWQECLSQLSGGRTLNCMIKVLACAIGVERAIRLDAPASLIALSPHKNRGSGYAAMPLAHDQELGLSLGALASPGILIGHRLITVGDEHALLAEEGGAFGRSGAHV